MGKTNYWDICNTSKLKEFLKSEQNLAKYKRIQCVYLRANNKLGASKIADMLGWNIGSVWNIHSSYKQYGNKIFNLKKKGGRYNENLSLEEEKQIISSCENEGLSGGIIEISKIKILYEEILGRKANKTIIYRMLSRHGWRKVAPRKKHPKNDKEAIEDFKKTSHHWYHMASL